MSELASTGDAGAAGQGGSAEVDASDGTDDNGTDVADGAVDDDSDADDTEAGQGGTTEVDKATKDAIKYRRALRAAEAQLQAQREAIVASVAQAHGIDARLLAAGGHTIDSLVDEHGVIDPAAVAQACEQVATMFNISRPTLRPNQQQGQPSGDPSIRPLRDALRGR